MKYIAFFLALLFALGGTIGLLSRAERLEQSEPRKVVAVYREPTTVPTTTTTVTPKDPTPFYPLTAEERDLVERVVMAEAGGEPEEGQRAVAQCILNAARLDGIRPDEVIIEYSYAKSRPEPTEQVKASVAAVFDEGNLVTDEPILFFYAPARCSSEWHETQAYVDTIGAHKFFKEANQ